MPRVVPSEIVAFIDKTIQAARRQLESNIKTFSIDRPQQFQCAALIDLIEQMPSELLVLPIDRYIELVTATAAIKFALEVWV